MSLPRLTQTGEHTQYFCSYACLTISKFYYGPMAVESFLRINKVTYRDVAGLEKAWEYLTYYLAMSALWEGKAMEHKIYIPTAVLTGNIGGRGEL